MDNDIEPQKTGHHFFTKKRVLYAGLALITIGVILGAGFLLIPRPITKWSYQPNIGYASTFFAPVVSNGMVYTIFTRSPDDNTVYALDENSGQVRWSFDIYNFISKSPVIADNTMYVLADDDIDRSSTLDALDMFSGKLRWSYQRKSLPYLPIVANGIIYMQYGDGHLLALDARSGHQKWDTYVNGDGFFDVPPIVVNNTIYVTFTEQSTKESTVSALDAVSGREKWSTQVTTATIGSSAVANGLVYIGANNANAQVSVFALDTSSGHLQWSYQANSTYPVTDNFLTSLSLQAIGKLVYVEYMSVNTSGDSNTGAVAAALYALNAQNGHPIWSTPTVSAEPLIANGEVYVYNSDDTLSDLNALSGRKQWSHKAHFFDDESLSIEPDPIIVDGVVYIRTNAIGGDTLYALNATTGNEQWSYKVGGYLSTPIAISKGIVYASVDDNLEAIQPPGGAPGFSR